MDSFLMMFGALHLIAYCLTGAFILITLGTMKVHMWFKVMSRILIWHIARARWKEGDPGPKP